MNQTRSIQSIFIACLLIFFSISASGCFYLVFGGAAAAGGYAISRDTIQGEVDRDFSQLWDTANDVIGIMGRIEIQNQETGEIVAIVQGSRVTVHLIQLTPSTIRLKVKARKAGFPRMGLAQDIYLKITSQVDK